MAWSTWFFAILPNLFIVGQEWVFGSLFFSLHALSDPQSTGITVHRHPFGPDAVD